MCNIKSYYYDWSVLSSKGYEVMKQSDVQVCVTF